MLPVKNSESKSNSIRRMSETVFLSLFMLCFYRALCIVKHFSQKEKTLIYFNAFSLFYNNVFSVLYLLNSRIKGKRISSLKAKNNIT